MQIKNSLERVRIALKEIYYLAQGGTAVGTGINSRRGWDKKIANEVKKITKLPFKTARNKFEALVSHDPVVNFSASLNTTAVALTKIANDIRFLDLAQEQVIQNLSYLKMSPVHPLCLEKLIQLNVRL